MKKIRLCILVAGVLCLSGCQKDERAQVVKVNTGDVANITGWSADISGIVQAYEDDQTLIENPAVRFEERGICWNTTGEPTRNDAFAADEDQKFGAYVCTATDLSCGTKYFVRTYVKSGRYMIYGEERSFTTPDLAKVETGVPRSVTGYTALIEGKILSDGGSDVQKCGVLYSHLRTPQQGDKQVDGTLENGVFQCVLTSLQHSTVYYVRTFVETAAGMAYGNTVSFTTLRMPTVLTKGFADRTETAVTVLGQVTDNGGEEITECGICYNTTGNPSISDYKLTHTATTEEFRCTITSMEHTQPYFARAYAVNTVGISYGDVLAFYWKPTVNTLATTNVHYTTATCNGNIVSNGGKDITECGICYSTEANPTIGNGKAVSATMTGTFSCQLTALQAGTVYHCRAYAVNAEGISYGDERSFTTLSYALPNVQTGGTANVSHTSAVCAANVLSDGGQPVTERGICYSLSSNPTTADSKVAAGAGTGSFTATLSDLQAGQTYHYRAYAVNAQGTEYGDERTFTTTSYDLPNVQTGGTTNVSHTSAVCAANVLSDGGLPVTERGICYSLSSNPTTAGSKAIAGAGTGSFTATLSDLQAGRTYYYRAYAISDQGIAYGEERTFKTLSYDLPTVQTGSTVSVGYTSAECAANVLSDGGQTVTERGICYSLSHNPTIDDAHSLQGNGVGSFTATLGNLKVGRTYYYRAYAINALGTAYGEEYSFTTENTFTIAPAGTNFTAQNITFAAYIGSGKSEPSYSETYGTLRIYANGRLTIESSVYTLRSVAITTDQPNLLANITSNTGSVSINSARTVVTWRGTADDIVLNIGERNIDDTKAGRLSIKSIDVVVEQK